MSEETTSVRAMPRYKSHKEVMALKLVGASKNDDGTVIIQPADASYPSFLADVEFGKRFNGVSDDPGYYVLYNDGYASWSPTKVFEEGYTLLDGGPDSA